jgi:nucleotide-binding universal stress UspA family protein
MLTKLLVAVDLSPCNAAVFAQGLELAQKTGASLVMLHVSSLDAPESPPMPMFAPNYYVSGSLEAIMATYDEQWRAYEEKGLATLTAFAQKAEKVGVMAECTQNYGSPGKIICDLANQMQADLIVVGRRGNSGLNELIMGSVSNYVLHHTARSVLVIQCNTADLTAQKSGH